MEGRAKRVGMFAEIRENLERESNRRTAPPWRITDHCCAGDSAVLHRRTFDLDLRPRRLCLPVPTPSSPTHLAWYSPPHRRRGQRRAALISAPPVRPIISRAPSTSSAHRPKAAPVVRQLTDDVDDRQEVPSPPTSASYPRAVVRQNCLAHEHERRIDPLRKRLALRD